MATIVVSLIFATLLSAMIMAPVWTKLLVRDGQQAVILGAVTLVIVCVLVSGVFGLLKRQKGSKKDVQDNFTSPEQEFKFWE